MFAFLLFKIFFARIIDVSIGTIRTILTIKGRSILPSVLAFFEVMVWFFVAKEALLIDVDSILIPIAYSLGYATGTYIGIIISNHFSKDIYEISIYNPNNNIKKYLSKNSLKILEYNEKKLSVVGNINLVKKLKNISSKKTYIIYDDINLK